MAVTAGITVGHDGTADSGAARTTILKDGYPRISEPEQFTREADIVVRGVIESIGDDRWTTEDGRKPASAFQGGPMAGHFIYRTGNLRVDEVMAGRLSESTIPITIQGGRVGDVQMFASGSGTLAVGDEVIVFVVAPGSTEAVRLANDSTWYPIEFYRVDRERGVATHQFHADLPVATLAERVRAEATRPTGR